MKQSLLFLFTLMVCLSGYPQNKNFDLSNYKFPDYKRHEMEFSLYSNGSNYKSFYLIPATTSLGESKNDASSSYFDSNLHAYYQFNHYTRERIDWVSIILNGKYQYDKLENGNTFHKNTQPSFWGSFNAKRRNYITEDKFYLEGSTYMRLDSYKRNITSDDLPKEITTNNSYSFNVGIGIGNGRIEHVNDLWQGYYILEKLKNQNSIKQDLNDDEIFEFSRFISKLNNKRFFDYRLRKIAELQALDSVLRKQGLIINEDIAYFTTLNDYWSFPISFDRKTGKEVGFNVTPQYYRNYYKTTNYTNKNNSAYLESTLYFDHSKQINLFWERNFHFDLINTTLLSEKNDDNTTTQKNRIATNASFDYGYFPNTRTRIQLNCKYFGSEYTNFQSENSTKSWMNSISLNLGIAYFISPQIQIAGNFSDSHWFSPLHSNHGHELDYNLSLRYAIF